MALPSSKVDKDGPRWNVWNEKNQTEKWMKKKFNKRYVKRILAYKKEEKKSKPTGCPRKIDLLKLQGLNSWDIPNGRRLTEAKTEAYNISTTSLFPLIEFQRIRPSGIKLNHPFYLKRFSQGPYSGKIYSSMNDEGSFNSANRFLMDDKQTKIWANITASMLGMYIHCEKPETLDLLRKSCPMTCNTEC